ncbi:MAG: hypothetical protein FJ290_26565 [Planctomycetes bacterium]|nr:hypothetical protein [Planctomycetota bacterium]
MAMNMQGLAALLTVGVAIALAAAAGEGTPPAPIALETEFLRYAVTADGRAAEFADKRTGKDHAVATPFAIVRRPNQTFAASGCSLADGKLTITFKDYPSPAIVAVTAKKRHLVFEVVSVGEEKPEVLSLFPAMVDLGKVRSNISGVAADDDFAACVRVLNLKSNTLVHGGPSPRFEVQCDAKQGIIGAKFALVGCPTSQLRSVLQEVLKEEGVLHSPLGGPFALDAEENRGSYVFAYGLSEANADEWVALAKKAGFAQVHLIGFEKSLGHYEPRPNLFPNGLAGLKAAVDKIHAAGMRAGMHTLTGCISTNDPFATPVPDKRLAKDATFTLAEAINETDKAVPTTEEPKGFDTMWAYAARGNVVQIDDELVHFGGLAPTGFTECRRGAFGTKATPHAKGTPVHHLFVRYCAFQPDPDSTLVDDVAECIARVYNTCGFDMIYMDGAEGMAGGWHGVSKMRAAIFRRLKGRVLVEASQWGYHSWPFHSRIGAYDYPHWALKRFIDIHCDHNDANRASSLLPTQLGWWAILGPSADHDAEFRDEIEYLCCKALATDSPMSFQGVGIGGKPANARQDEYLDLIGRYERLRLARSVPEAVRKQLRTPKADFRLVEAGGKPQFVPTDYLAHKVTGLKDGKASWTVKNRFAAQPLRLRIQVLYSAAPYDSPEAVTLASFNKQEEFAVSGAAQGVTAEWTPMAIHGNRKGPPEPCAQLKAKSTLATRVGAWAKLTKTFIPPLDLRKHGALGLWVQGDGKGQLLNFQLTNPPQFWGTFDEHYVDVDTTAWRYVELHLRERDAERFGDYTWPYGGIYDVYRSPLIRSHVSALNLYVNNLPPNDTASCLIGQVKALPVAKVKLANPTITVGGAKVTFPVTLESGQYIEMESATDCRLHDDRGALLQQLTPQGDVPTIAPGGNSITFTCAPPEAHAARANVTVITVGQPL